MTDHRVKVLLLCTILVTTGVPLLAAFYFLDGALERSLNLGFNAQIVGALELAAQNLKSLKDARPEDAARYREQFAQIEELRHIYSQPEVVKSTVRGSLKVYFGVGLIGAVLMSMVVALLLSRKINRSYKATFGELMAQRDRVRYLEQMASWQELARMLAHEIKNPLTPIEVLVTSLTRAHRDKSPEQFGEQLRQTQAMIGEEISHLKRTVSRFTDFARLPEAQLTEQSPVDLIQQHIQAVSMAFESADLRLKVNACPADLRVRADSSLFRQVLMNIVANGVEANPGRRVTFSIRIGCRPQTVRIAILNDGVPVPPDIAERMFDPYISSKSGKDNMGLGLAIVKKIVIEHGGEIAYAEVAGHPCFTLSLARVH